MSSLGRRVAESAAWTGAIRLVTRLLSIISTVILARLLTPADFGLYALAMMVFAFVELLRAFGFGVVLIQNREASPAHYHTAWTMHCLFSLVAAAALWFVAPMAAAFLGEPYLAASLRFLCLLLFIDGLTNIGIIDFQKQLRFDREFRLAVATKLVGFCVTVPLAFLWRSHWAMLFGLLASSATRVLLSYLMHSFRPRFQLTLWRELFSFTVWLQANNLINFFNKHVENLLVSRTLGVASVGSLTMAREVGLLLRELMQPINRAAYPGFAKANNDPAAIRELYCAVLGFMFLAGVPVASGLSAVAHLFVPTVLGSQWLHLIPLVQLFGLVSVLSVVMASGNNVLIALGRPRLATAIISCRLAVFVAVLVWGLPRYELLSVPYAMGVSLACALCLSFYHLYRAIGLTAWHMLAVLGRPLVAAALMYLAVQAAFPAPAASEATASLQNLLAAAALGALVYMAVVMALWLLQGRPCGAEARLLAEWRLRLARWRAASAPEAR